jgi:O-antigen ligase
MYYSSGIFYLVGKDPTLSGRTDIWKAIVVSALKRPILGYGYMAFFNGIKGENANAGLSVQWGGLSASHNGFLDVWVSLGFVGVGLIVYTFYRAFKNAIVCLCGVRSPYLVWCSCVVVLMLVVNLDEKAMMVPNDLIWILYVLACLALYEGAANILKPRLNHA